MKINYKGEFIPTINLKELREGSYYGNKIMYLTGHGHAYKFMYDIWKTNNGLVAVLDKVICTDKLS